MGTTFWPLADAEASRTGDRETSPWCSPLDSAWEFQGFSSPNVVPTTVLTYGGEPWATVEVSGCWQRQGHGRPAYPNIRMPFPNTPPRVPEAHRTGVYHRHLQIPTDWKGRRILIHFGSADSLLYLYVNGRSVGMSKDSRLPAEFDRTGLVEPGSDCLLTAVVVQWSDASNLEDQDPWWLSGFPRRVLPARWCMTSNSLPHFLLTQRLGMNRLRLPSRRPRLMIRRSPSSLS